MIKDWCAGGHIRSAIAKMECVAGERVAEIRIERAGRIECYIQGRWARGGVRGQDGDRICVGLAGGIANEVIMARIGGIARGLDRLGFVRIFGQECPNDHSGHRLPDLDVFELAV